MKKGYKETLPLGPLDQNGAPIWGPEQEKERARKRRRKKVEKPPMSERITVIIGCIFIFAGVVWVIWRS